MTDDEFLTSFTNCTLDRSHFNHLGHVRLAWIHLQRQPFDEAVARTCGGIRNYATSLGAAGKFHWTITEVLMHLLRAAGGTDRDLGWQDFIAANAALVADARGRVGEHYSDLYLDTPEARQRFVAPDLRPLPA